MEKWFEYLFVNLEVKHNVAPILALIIAIMDNKSRGFKDCLIVSILALGVAGVVEDYLPTHTLWISICIGVSSGVCTDALYDKFVERFPSIIDNILNMIMEGIKGFINRMFGK